MMKNSVTHNNQWYLSVESHLFMFFSSEITHKKEKIAQEGKKWKKITFSIIAYHQAFSFLKEEKKRKNLLYEHVYLNKKKENEEEVRGRKSKRNFEIKYSPFTAEWEKYFVWLLVVRIYVPPSPTTTTSQLSALERNLWKGR